MKKITNRIITLAVACLGMACGTGIVAAANEVIKTAYIENGVIYNDAEMTEVADELYVGDDGTLYIDSEMTIAVPHKTDFDVNENGETFGSASDVIYVEDEPDLMAALGDNGKEGYIRKSEADGGVSECSTPEETVRKIEELTANGPRVINLYESDGVTVIDTFTMGDRIIKNID